MCGILLIAHPRSLPGDREPELAAPDAPDFAEGLGCRGPDAQGTHEVSCESALLRFHGSLLQLRGAAASSSPLVDASGNVLLFNGQIFPPCFLDVPPGASDAQLLLAALGAPGADVPAVLTGLRGPWSLAYWHSATRTLWFGRDPIGRRSLLVHPASAADGRFMLSSSAPLDPAVPFQGFEELPPGMYSLAVKAGRQQDATAADAGAMAAGAAAGAAMAWARYQRHDWTDPAVRSLTAFWRDPALVEPPPSAGMATGTAAVAGAEADAAAAAAATAVAGKAGAEGGRAQGPPPLAVAGTPDNNTAAEGPAFEHTVDVLLSALRQAVATRCRCIDDAWRQAAASLQQQEPEGIAVGTGAGALAEPLRSLQASAGVNTVDERQHMAAGPAAPGTASPGPSSPRSTNSQPPAATAPPVRLLPPAPVLVLFSGGVDSTLLAALAHEALPPEAPIDLASVCFDGGASPDRLSALDALAELRQLAPERQWRLIQVDCTLADVEAARPRLLRLLAPSDTVMDLNIGAALWLAARGAGTLLPDQAEGPVAGQASQLAGTAAAGAPAAATAARHGLQPAGQPAGAARCASAARVVLLGHGADELFGGYGRHRTAFRARGWQGLGDELSLDLRRLWLRNLGRDDRLVADHGREARHPFLDEGVVAAALAAPLRHLADLRLHPGDGDKRVLRACLRRLGLTRAAARAKRAIQFGSRLAAKTNSATFGGTRRANLLNAGSVRLADIPAAPAGPAVPATMAAAGAAGAAAGNGLAVNTATAEQAGT